MGITSYQTFRRRFYTKSVEETDPRDGSRPRDFLHRLSSNIEALSTGYHTEKHHGRFSSWARAAAHSSAVSTSSGSGTPSCRSSKHSSVG